MQKLLFDLVDAWGKSDAKVTADSLTPRELLDATPFVQKAHRYNVLGDTYTALSSKYKKGSILGSGISYGKVSHLSSRACYRVCYAKGTLNHCHLTAPAIHTPGIRGRGRQDWCDVCLQGDQQGDACADIIMRDNDHFFCCCISLMTQILNVVPSVILQSCIRPRFSRKASSSHCLPRSR